MDPGPLADNRRVCLEVEFCVNFGAVTKNLRGCYKSMLSMCSEYPQEHISSVYSLRID